MIRCTYCGSPIEDTEIRWVGESFHGPCLDLIATGKQRQAEVELAALESRNRVETVMPYRRQRRRAPALAADRAAAV